MAAGDLDLPHLKQVSLIKHKVLTKYLPTWAVILSSRHKLLYYVDCFAGPGRYESQGVAVPGSPIIAVSEGKKYAAKNPDRKLGVVLIDKNPDQHEQLSESLAELKPFPDNFAVKLHLGDARDVVPRVVEQLQKRGMPPTFFLVDPYGHPLSVPAMNEILDHKRQELFINLMWFRINMDMATATVQKNVDDLFGATEWRNQPFIRQSGQERERAFLEFFESKLHAKYVLRFRIRFDAKEDGISSTRTKYYLLHASNEIKAVLLMKEVMWSLGDEQGTFEYSGTSQEKLFSQTPNNDDLKAHLLSSFKGQRLTYDEVRERTWRMPFIDKHYRTVLQELRKEMKVEVTPVSSKGKGLSGADILQF